MAQINDLIVLGNSNLAGSIIATGVGNSSSTASKIAVLDDAGNVYYRTLAQIKTDVGLSNYLPLSGGTMTGMLKTSFKSAVAVGSYQATATTIPNLLTELRYSNGAMGSVSITTAYTYDSYTIATGWYNYIYIPHRNGGNNGAANGDNTSYGTLLLYGMTLNNANYRIRFARGSIGEVTKLTDSADTSAFVKKSGDTMTGNLNISQSSNPYVGVTNGSLQAYFQIYNSKCYIGFGTSTSPYITTTGEFTATKVWGAVWNDYAEFRSAEEEIQPGYCVRSQDNGVVRITDERLCPVEGIVSDTFGFAIGKTETANTPLAVSGRVLAYPAKGEIFHAGDVVGATTGGFVTKMSREEIRDYPDRIVGTVSEIPEYDIWGEGKVKVNGRIWIKVK